MNGMPDDPILLECAKRLADMRWAALILDVDMRLVWVSDELKGFVGETDNESLGYGENIVTAFLRPIWRGRIDLESQARMFVDLVPAFLDLMPESQRHVLDDLPDPFHDLMSQVEPRPSPGIVTTYFDYKEEDEPVYRVNLAALPLTRGKWEPAGVVALTFVDVRPKLVSLLTQGDEAMYERMARLVDPGRRQASILFGDVQASGAISRQMPSGAYFALMRKLATCVDGVIAQNSGVIGKHAGDGMTGFFLVEDLGSSSRAAAAAVSSAKQLREVAHLAFQEFASDVGVFDEMDFTMNVGVHWGGTLYMGQLVPGGRLDVTALGDEMNECARIQESARDGAILASKTVREHLTDDVAARVGIDPDKQFYRPLADLETATEKAKRDAGGLPVTDL